MKQPVSVQLELALEVPRMPDVPKATAAARKTATTPARNAAAPRNNTATPARNTVSLTPGRPGLRVIQGGGQRVLEPLDNRNAVVRVLVEAGADLLLKRISPLRAEEIERNVNKVLGLFDKVDATPALMPVLRRELDDLEALMAETRALRVARRTV
ncbi:MAG: hypothetical protein ACT4TC_08975 [Myxococcaceae bacterium]